MNSFSERLKKLRIENNLSQKSLAKKLGFCRTTISNYEQGIRLPAIDILNTIAIFFGVSLDYLMGDSNSRLSSKDYSSRNNELQKEKEKSLTSDLTDSLINILGKTVYYKSPYKINHPENVASLSSQIGQVLSLSVQKLHTLKTAGLLHDIGKINIPEVILDKPDNLSESEYNLIKEHPLYGYDIVKNIPFKQPVAEIVKQHHERLDGSGYPLKLKSKQILIEAKIIAVADVVDAITSNRPYRKAFNLDYALNVIKNNTKYDQEVVEACIYVLKNKLVTSINYPDC